MDFAFTPEQDELRALARQVLSDHASERGIRDGL